MITPAYALTATERVLPRMALDFTTGVLDPRVSVARALNTATRVNSSGYIEIVNANLPRFDYDSTTLAPKGLLIEESRTNLLTNSSDFTNALWLKLNASVTANATTSPDGTNNATKMVESATSGVHAMYQDFLVVSGTAYTASIFVKAAERTWCVVELGGPPLACSVYVNLATGATGTQSGSPSSVVVTPYKDGWWRIQISKTASATPGAGNLAVYPATGNGGVSYAGNGTSGIFVYGGSSEAGAFATSYIPTTTTSLTRNADVVSMTGTNFSDWYNASQGALEAEYSSYVAANSFNSKAIFAFSDGTNNNRIYANINTSGIPFVFVSSSGATQANISTAETLVNGATAQTVCTYKQDSYAAATNGRSPGTDVSALVPVVNQIVFGSSAGFNCLFGHMRKVMYWPQRITNAETQAFSK